MSFQAASLLRDGLAVVAGLGVGSAVNMGLIVFNTSVLYPMPAGLSFDDKEAFAKYIQNLPPLAYIMVLAAHYGQAVVGGALAAYLASSTTSASICCYVVGAATMVGAIMETMSLPVPPLMWLEIPFYPFLAFATIKFTEQYFGLLASGSGVSKTD